MNEKLNIQNLIELLAEKHGMDKADAESFVKEFFQLIEESLENDKYVKIRGLGTFKLIDVESRESVNINTGERFEIQGHTKVSFAPEPALKDLINKPFSHFETVVLNDETVLEDTPVEDNRNMWTGNKDKHITTTANGAMWQRHILGDYLPLQYGQVRNGLFHSQDHEGAVLDGRQRRRTIRHQASRKAFDLSSRSVAPRTQTIQL